MCEGLRASKATSNTLRALRLVARVAAYSHPLSDTALNPNPIAHNTEPVRMHRSFFPACLVAATLTGCQATTNPGANGTPGMIACPQERPEICTQEYDPVCAVIASGQHQTYSNACHACADETVGGYRPGACAED